MDLLPYERSTCFWQRIAYLYARFDELITEATDPDDYELGAAYLALHTLRCRSRATQHRLADGEPLGPGNLDRQGPAGHRRAATVRHRARPAARRRSSWTTHRGGRSTCTRARRPSTAAPPRSSAISSRAGCSSWARSERGYRVLATCLEDGLRKTMTGGVGSRTGPRADRAGLAGDARRDAGIAIPLVFRLLGETGAHAPVLNDVVLRHAGRDGWRHRAAAIRGRLVGGLGAHRPGRLGAGRRPADTPRAPGEIRCRWPRAGARSGWWLVGAGRAMLSLARQHALDRVQFGRPVASFQAIRHRLAETLVAIEGAEATLLPPRLSRRSRPFCSPRPRPARRR